MTANILIGQHDSPFVRRVGIALTLYGLSFEHAGEALHRMRGSARVSGDLSTDHESDVGAVSALPLVHA
jgi:hypothetical protein